MHTTFTNTAIPLLPSGQKLWCCARNWKANDMEYILTITDSVGLDSINPGTLHGNLAQQTVQLASKLGFSLVWRPGPVRYHGLSNVRET